MLLFQEIMLQDLLLLLHIVECVENDASECVVTVFGGDVVVISLGKA
jgi:hypothetical protein